MGGTPTVAGVLLAAGAGRRFEGDTHKLLAALVGRPVLAHALEAVLAAGFDEVIVVSGAVDVAHLLPAGVRLVHNPDWAAGQAGSLQRAVAAAAQRGHDAVVVGLGDQPRVPAGAWRRVASSPSPIAVATYGGRRRNPVRLHRSVWPLLETGGDEGARTVMKAHPELVVEVPCDGDPLDVDTVDDLDRLQRDETR